MPAAIAAPPHDCALCPRLAAFRAANRAANPGWFNAPVPSFGPMDARLLVVGMAPGLRGANRTGRPFTGDHAGILLYSTLIRFGLASGAYAADPADGLTLVGTRITNAVRCVPPANKLERGELGTCNRFLVAELENLPKLKAILALGLHAHDAVLLAHKLRRSSLRFAHGAQHALPNGLFLVDSYHVSRLNTATGRLTTAMFESVVRQVSEAAG